MMTNEDEAGFIITFPGGNLLTEDGRLLLVDLNQARVVSQVNLKSVIATCLSKGKIPRGIIPVIRVDGEVSAQNDEIPFIDLIHV